MFRRAILVALVLLVLAVLASYAVAQTPAGNAPAGQTITGCLQKGLESGGFYLLTTDNKHWEVYNAGNVPLGDHVGQTVTLAGSFPTRTATQEQVSQPYEKKETGTRQHGDFAVSSLKVVSATCGK